MLRREFLYQRVNRRSAAPASLTTVLLAALVITLAGCGSGEALKPADASAKSSELELEIGYAGYGDEAISQLTKVLLEERMGHGKVELRRVGIDEAYRDVADRKLDAFQGVRMPLQQAEFDKVSDRAVMFHSWIIGTTRASLAVPAYLNVRNPERLDSASASNVLTIRSDASPVGEIPSGALSDYGLRVEHEYPSAVAMLEKADQLYKKKKPFVFIAWTPHRLNDEYDINYLEDPKGSLSEITRPGSVHMLVRKDLQQRDPSAHAIMDAIKMTETQAMNLQTSVQEAKQPEEGVRDWIKQNHKLVKSWVEASKRRVKNG